MKTRTSCDACRLRKTRCDLWAKAARAQSQMHTLSASSASSSQSPSSNGPVEVRSCSFCTSLGIPCTTKEKQQTENGDGASLRARSVRALTLSQRRALGRSTIHAPRLPHNGKHRRGKRISRLLQGLVTDSEPGTSHSSSASRSLTRSASKARRQGDSQLAEMNTPISISFQDFDNAEVGIFEAPMNEVIEEQCVLGIQGLSMDILRGCIQAFFNFPALWLGLSQDNVTVGMRIQLKLNLLSRSILDLSSNATLPGLLRLPADNDVDSGISPVSTLLLLALAGRGAYYSKYAYFEERIKDRFTALLPAQMLGDDLDDIEALVLYSNHRIHGRMDQEDSDTAQTPFSNTSDGTTMRALKANQHYLLTNANLVHWCLSARLNLEHTGESPQTTRRWIIFWTIFCYDALQSSTRSTACRLNDCDVGWPVIFRPPTRVVEIAMAARELCNGIFSARATLEGVSEERMTKALDDLDVLSIAHSLSIPDLDALAFKLKNQGKVLSPAQLDSHHNSVVETKTVENDIKRQFVKRAVCTGLYLRLYLSFFKTVHLRMGLCIDGRIKQIMLQVRHLAELCVNTGIIDYLPFAVHHGFVEWVNFIFHHMDDRLQRFQEDSERNAKDQSQERLELRHEVEQAVLVINGLLRAMRGFQGGSSIEHLAINIESRADILLSRVEGRLT